MTRTKDDWTAAGVVLTRALAGVHTAVGLSLLAPGKVPLVAAGLAGCGVFWAAGRYLREMSAGEAAGFTYALPVAGLTALRLTLSDPQSWDAAQREAGRFVAAVWAATPVAAYLAAAAVALLALRVGAPGNPFNPPPR